MISFIQRAHRLATVALLGLAPLYALNVQAETPAAEDKAPLKAETKATRPTAMSPHAARVGQGSYSYRFVVPHPEKPNHAYARGRYQVLIRSDEIQFPNGKNIYRGVADAKGYTARFYFETPLDTKQLEIQPLVGKGEFGESYRFTTQRDSPLPQHPYLVSVSTGPVYCGHTLKDGLTARYMTENIERIRIFHVPFAVCQRLQKKINPVMARSSNTARLRGLEALLKITDDIQGHDQIVAQPLLERIVQQKIDYQVIRHGDKEAITELIVRETQKALCCTTKNDNAAHATGYNNIAYRLIDQNPPRFVEYANELIDRSLRLDETRYNLDSKGWVLHLLGQHEEALGFMNKSLAAFPEECNTSITYAYQEALWHRGKILWTMKRYSEAIDDWAVSQLVSQRYFWGGNPPVWDEISPIIRQRVLALREAQFTPPACRPEPPQRPHTRP